jgi:hypothetical protein
MAGRPPKPTNLLAITGQLARNPKRYEKRKGEPRPDAALGPAPARWQLHPAAFKASALFADGKSTNEVRDLLGIPWETARDLRDSTRTNANAHLCQLWDELNAMAPWLTNADRWVAESICQLKLAELQGTIRPGERAELGRLCGKCGLNPSDRTRVSTLPKAPRKSEPPDPRDMYLLKSKARTG